LSKKEQAQKRNRLKKGTSSKKEQACIKKEQACIKKEQAELNNIKT